MKYLLLTLLLFGCTSSIVKVECKETRTNKKVMITIHRNSLHNASFWKRSIFRRGNWVCERK